MGSGVHWTKGKRRFGLHDLADARGGSLQILALPGVQRMRCLDLDLSPLTAPLLAPDASHDAPDDDEREMADGALRQPARSPFRRDQPLAGMAADGIAVEVGQKAGLIARRRPGFVDFAGQQPGARAFDLDLF
jgi:hypothetical protein